MFKQSIQNDINLYRNNRGIDKIDDMNAKKAFGNLCVVFFRATYCDCIALARELVYILLHLCRFFDCVGLRDCCIDMLARSFFSLWKLSSKLVCSVFYLMFRMHLLFVQCALCVYFFFVRSFGVRRALSHHYVGLEFFVFLLFLVYA